MANSRFFAKKAAILKKWRTFCSARKDTDTYLVGFNMFKGRHLDSP